MPPKTRRIEKRTYFVHEAGNLHWKILVRKDSNSTLYDPVFRKGWQDGGEVEIFSLLPPADSGDEPLLHIRIYTKYSWPQIRTAFCIAFIMVCQVFVIVHVLKKEVSRWSKLRHDDSVRFMSSPGASSSRPIVWRSEA